jgi:DNA replication ATP-dependent helicase Dna2
MLSVKDERTQNRYIILLRQSWYDTRCTKGSYVHIIGEFDHRGQCIIDDAENMIIIHPDHLISATVVSDSFTCTRRAALQDRIKSTSRATAPMVYGHIIHEMFGEALRLGEWTRETFVEIIQKLLPSYLESLYEIGVAVPDAREYLLSKTPELIGWAHVFVGDEVNMDAVARDRNGALVPTAVNKLLELEEHVWSPMHGLKGNIDATVQVKMRMPGDRLPKTLVVPLEFKTSKKDNNETHRAQTALYTLLLSDRYDVNVTCGVLYYLETSKTFRVEAVRNEIRNMIIERNNLACYVHDKLELPPMLKKPYLCKSCYSKNECFSYHKLVDGGDGETSGLGDVFTEMTTHLRPNHAEFFRKWDDLLTKEERDSMRFKRELWTMLSTERQAVGRCFANVIIQPGTSQENKESSKINRFEYTFIKDNAEAGFSFTESQITTGEPIVISDERGHFNLASGYVINVRPKRVVVAVDRRLQDAQRRCSDFDSESNQVFVGLMESNNRHRTYSHNASPDPPRLFRIDKDEFANGMATARNNLIRIMEKDLFKARELRQLIVDSTAPSFRSSVPKYTLAGPASQQQLNSDQQHAIEKVLSAKDYALVLGMPGTGKTTTIAHIIRALVSQGKSVLLTSYTHTAVDNILLKIKDDKIPVLRIGNIGKVHPQVREFADLTAVPKNTIEELHASWHDSKVVATTCLGINHALFNARTFDYCIVDEASQITLPVCLGPIRHAQTFILVGDHYQLPPLVQNKEAQQGGLNVSLFKLLSDAHPASVANLEHQYRMAEEVQLLSSTLVYGGRLKCGTPGVASRILRVPDLEVGLSAYHYNSGTSLSRASSNHPTCANDSTCFIRHALTPANRCVFLDTDQVQPSNVAHETVAGPRLTNAVESILISQLVTVLIRAGVAPSSIGVITFYRSQLAMLRQDIKGHAGSAAAAEVEMHTADKYQGRDKEIVFLSCVRSNDEGKVGELLKDWRRVNVAVTRAKSKLVIIGSASTLGKSEVPILAGMVRIMGEKGWIKAIEGPLQGSHSFPVAPTQTQAPSSQRRSETSAKSATKRSPLQPLSGSSNTSPVKRIKVPGGAFKKPRRVADGKTARAHMIVEQSAVLQEVLIEGGSRGQENADVEYGGLIESSPLVDDLDVIFDDVAF